MKPATITRMLHSRGVMSVMIMAVAAVAAAAFVFGGSERTIETNGFVTLCSGTYVVPSFVSLGCGVALIIGVALLLNIINRRFNLLRTRTSLQCSAFLLMMLASPALAVYANMGTLMCAVILLCSMILYGQYANHRYDKRNILLVFLILSVCSSFDYRYALYVPVMAVGCWQMRIFTMRTLIAMLTGLLTPWVIAFGFGLLTLEMLRLPEISFVLTGVYGTSASLFVGVAVYTALLTVGCLLQCVIKIMSYTAHARAQLSFITLLTVVTLAFAVLNSVELALWVPMVNCCAALQLAHLFCAIHTYPKSYIAIISLTAVYVLAFGAQIAIALL